MGARPETVLVVEDESDLVALITAYLEEEYVVRTASNCADALRAVDDEVDVVLLDRRTPGMAAGEFVDALRDREINARIAMVSGMPPDTETLAMSIDEYVTKPVGKDDLLELVESLVDR